MVRVASNLIWACPTVQGEEERIREPEGDAQMFFYKILIGAVFFGLLVGLSRAKFRLAPILVSGLLILGYGISITVRGIWAAQCWDCTEYHDSRGMVFGMTLALYGFIAGASLLSIWAGAVITMLFLRPHKAQPPR